MESYLATALIFIAAGVVLLVAEFFLPTGGPLAVAGITCFAVAVGIVFLYGTATEALVASLALSIGVPVVGYFMFSAWQRLMPSPAIKSESAQATIHEMPEIAELDRLKGRYGKALTPLRPSGSVEIDGRRTDAQSEGMMIESGARVKCVDVKAGRVIVRQMDPPADLSNIDLDEFK